MFKKIILAIVMLAAIFTIGYFKVKRGNASTENSYQQAQVESREQLWGYEKMVDSLKYLMDQQKFMQEKLLQRNEIDHQWAIDSLVRLLDEGTSPTVKIIPEPISEIPEPVDTVAQAKELALQSEVIDFYKALYSKLPKDLSSYERRVALYEIRLNTSKKFQLSLVKLKEIRSLNHLTY